MTSINQANTELREFRSVLDDDDRTPQEKSRDFVAEALQTLRRAGLALSSTPPAKTGGAL